MQFGEEYSGIGEMVILLLLVREIILLFMDFLAELYHITRC